MTDAAAAARGPGDLVPGSWKEDLSGGFASAVVSVVGNVAAGVVAFAPLGPDYVAHGILAGMFCSIVAGALATVTGATPGLIIGPKTTTAMVFASLLGQVIAAGGLDLASAADVNVAISLALAAVMIGGSFQLLLGAFRVGTIVTFIPYPVVAGIRNGAALLLILSQIGPVLGIQGVDLLEIPGRIGEFHPSSFSVALLTALVVWYGGRLMPSAVVPATALLLGALLHHGMVATIPGVDPGPVLGSLASAIPTPAFADDLLGTVTSGRLLALLPVIVTGGLAIAVLDSVSSLITVVAFQSLTNRRYDANRHLIGLGVGNLVGPVFGGISASAIYPRSALNHQGGGRTSLSGVANAAFVLVLLLLLAGPLSLLPKAAIAGLVIVVAIKLFDDWTIELVREVLRRETTPRQDTWVNLAEMLFVVAVAIAVSLVAAVGAGVVLSIMVFVAQMSRSPIRRVRGGDVVRSKHRRDPRGAALLEEHGDRIALMELEGTVFFGSADAVGREMEELVAGGADHLAIDLRRVKRIDSTGFRALGAVYLRLSRQGVRLAFSSVDADDDPSEIGRGLLRTAKIPPEQCFDSSDHALERLEDQLLEELEAGSSSPEPWSATQFAESMGLEGDEIDVFCDLLVERHFEPGEPICRQGDPGSSLYMISVGSADTSIYIPEHDRVRRLDMLTQGTLFGELSFLDSRPRSADVIARNELVCFELDRAALDDVATRHPTVAVKLHAFLGRLLGSRLRDANKMIFELEF